MTEAEIKAMKSCISKIHRWTRPDCWLLPYNAIKAMFVKNHIALNECERLMDTPKPYERKHEEAIEAFENTQLHSRRALAYYGKPLYLYESEVEFNLTFHDLSEVQGLKVGILLRVKPNA